MSFSSQYQCSDARCCFFIATERGGFKMKISDLIKDLAEEKERHGDLEVVFGSNNEGVYFKIKKVQHYNDFKPDTLFLED